MNIGRVWRQAARQPETGPRTADAAVDTADIDHRGNQGRATTRRAVAGSQGPRQAPHPSPLFVKHRRRLVVNVGRGAGVHRLVFSMLDTWL